LNPIPFSQKTGNCRRFAFSRRVSHTMGRPLGPCRSTNPQRWAS